MVPDKEKIISDMKAFMSHHEIPTALKRKKLKESEKKLEEAKVQIQTLNTKILDVENRSEMIWKQNAQLRISNYDLTNNLKTTKAQIGKFKTSLKEKEEEISRLEMEVEKLSEFKQKVELAERIFKTPIKNINFNINVQESETHLAIPGSSDVNDEPEAGIGRTVESESDLESEPESESEISTSENKISTRGSRAKRGRPS